jgi:hypothetical protein
MQSTDQTPISFGWQPFNLDHYAQELVIQRRDKRNVLNESHRMRTSISYGLERFWGEHLRYERENSQESREKGDYWKAVWIILAKILESADINLPDEKGDVRLDGVNSEIKIQAVAQAIWNMPRSDQRVALMVLTQLCDSLVWWTQRYRKRVDAE